MNQEEVWKIVKDFPNYEVSNMGNVRNVKNGKIMGKKQSCTKYGYRSVLLTREDLSEYFLIHVLVAKNFIDNPNNYTRVGHIDRNITNNNVENLRWETAQQNTIQRPKQRPKTSSIYKGVSLFKYTNKWQAYITKDKRIHLGYFDTELEAAKAYDEAAKQLYGDFVNLNLEVDERKQNSQQPINYNCIQRKLGVTFCKKSQKWYAYINKDKKNIRLGGYDTELQAARVYDKAAKELYKEFAKLNFEDEDSDQVEIKIRQKHSIYRGVSFKKRENKWCAYIYIDKKPKNLGQFDTELEAAKAYDIAEKEIFGENARLNLKDDVIIQSEKIKKFSIEAILQKEKKQKTSIYKGVSFHKKSQKWAAQIQNNNIKIGLGYFDTELEAAQAYDIAAKELYKESAELNFKDEVNIQSEKIKNFSLQAILQKGKRQNSSIYKGVSFQKEQQKWRGYICVDKNIKHLGLFKTELEAARAYDKAAKELHKERAKLNFKDEEELTEQLANLNINEDKQE